MRAVIASIVLFGLGFADPASAQVEDDFAPMADACYAFVADGRFPDASGEVGFFSRRGFRGAGSSTEADSVSRSYTRSGTPMDPVRIMTGRPATAGGEDCTVLGMSGPESGDALLVRIQSDASWRATGESDDENGKGFLFERDAGAAVVQLTIWGTGASYPISVASYQLGTSD